MSKLTFIWYIDKTIWADTYIRTNKREEEKWHILSLEPRPENLQYDKIKLWEKTWLIYVYWYWPVEKEWRTVVNKVYYFEQ